uniref:Major sperm protein n=1 Tax=Panagrolaimus sp. JU765 TaxID=591449 RepID=A0AC34QGX4_9BILA
MTILGVEFKKEILETKKLIELVILVAIGLMIIVIVIIIIIMVAKCLRKKAEKKKKDDLKNVVVVPNQQTAEKKLQTGSKVDFASSTMIDDLHIEPVPLVVNDKNGGVIALFNNMENNFFAVRFLTKNPGILKVYPTKIIVPPQKKISVKIIMGLMPKTEKEMIILAEYFNIGENLLTLTPKDYWKPPFIAPQKNWKFKFLQVYYENDEIMDVINKNDKLEKSDESSQQQSQF